jgi:hypothetical protein
MAGKQGDPIGRIFAPWVIFHLWELLVIDLISINFFGHFFSTVKYYKCVDLDINGLWAIFFANSSGHPAGKSGERPLTIFDFQLRRASEVSTSSSFRFSNHLR